MMEIYYLNARGEKLNLVEWPYRIQTGDLLNYKKEYYFSESSHGANILGFNTKISEKSITLTVSATDKKEYYAALNRFFDVVDSDTLSLTPGRLYFNGQYMRCYIFGSEKTEWEYGCNFLDNVISIVSGKPLWITEKALHFLPGGQSIQYVRSYPYDYPTDYSPVVLKDSIVNDNYSATDFRMTIYGPVVNPSVSIGENVYHVLTDIQAGEYLIIDTREKVVEQYDGTGGMVQKYNGRDKTHEIYAKIQPGVNTVLWDGAFGFDITTFAERSEPKWTL